MNIRKDLYHYKDNKRMIKQLDDDIAIFRARAEKITPTYSNDKGGFSLEVHSKVEDNAIKIIELENRQQLYINRVKRADAFLKTLKPYQRTLIRYNLIDHIPYKLLARKEKTTVQNISKIINKALKEEKWQTKS